MSRSSRCTDELHRATRSPKPDLADGDLTARPRRLRRGRAVVRDPPGSFIVAANFADAPRTVPGGAQQIVLATGDAEPPRSPSRCRRRVRPCCAEQAEGVVAPYPYSSTPTPTIPARRRTRHRADEGARPSALGCAAGGRPARRPVRAHRRRVGDRTLRRPDSFAARGSRGHRAHGRPVRRARLAVRAAGPDRRAVRRLGYDFGLRRPIGGTSAGSRPAPAWSSRPGSPSASSRLSRRTATRRAVAEPRTRHAFGARYVLIGVVVVGLRR